MGGVEDPAGELSAEISAVLALEVDRPEWEFLGNGRLLSIASVITALAANPAYLRLRNPATSGMLAVIEAANITVATGPATVNALIGTAVTDRGVVIGKMSRDSRSGTTSGALVASTDNTVGVGTSLEQFQLVVNTKVRFDTTEWILAPGSHIDIGDVSNIQDTYVNVKWRERAIQPYELPR
jgi:hypothetical protein